MSEVTERFKFRLNFRADAPLVVIHLRNELLNERLDILVDRFDSALLTALFQAFDLLVGQL